MRGGDAMSELTGGRFTRNGIQYNNAWFLYAALADTRRAEFVVKVGVSTVPLKRMADIHMGSPYPIVAGMWALVGGRSKAMKAESRVKKAFSDRRTRGEWFEFDSTNPADRERFNRTMRTMAEIEAGRPVQFQRVTQERLKAYVAAVCKQGIAIRK